MITKYGTATITEDGVTMDGFWFGEDSQPVNDAARWAISKLEELCDQPKDADKQLDFAIRVFKEGCEAPDRITVTFPGWTKI